ncbi:putative integral membrane protein (TIGR00698 family) [Microterricola gilva]|uniref:Putative integral membrane protein (TIGR00698 family) n=1 Tax=Microterricola gilva TaxID=393267 RepID=A0A4Q8AMX5_9MICO|nr:putative sulfate exporter family transporter [Microterricola gilva]RZU65962.1 putative integral membrane protein (TIGR00698 family) [Microterricola gilva]
MKWLPGVALAGAAALVAWAIHALIPAIPLLTAAVAIGIIVGQIPAARGALNGILAPGLSVASKQFMRLGIVLLGLKLSLVDILGLGWLSIVMIVAIVLLTFVGTIGLGRAFGLPGHQPLLIATGFSICGASAIGAMSGVVKAKDEETATPIALVTLCGTLAIAVLPLLWHPLGLSNEQFGQWVGASVHDVGQVVATAQIAGPAALAVAIVVKLTRVLMLAPVVAVAAGVERRRHGAAVELATRTGAAAPDAAARPPIVPLFVAGFLAAVLVRTLFPVPESVLEVADWLQTALLAMALFGLGSAVRLGELVRTGWRALLVGLLSWTLIASLAYGAVQLP